jgi:hypothetical protein
MLVLQKSMAVLEFGLVPKHHGIWHLAVFRGQSDDTSNHEHTMSLPISKGVTRRHFFVHKLVNCVL